MLIVVGKVFFVFINKIQLGKTNGYCLMESGCFPSTFRWNRAYTPSNVKLRSEIP